uniref:Neuronal PAS domain protein 4a n=1 Tax=Gasterosteus aculeatus aculeatus TaxID=481459 RepID=A0AAQ4QWL0_GASAC
MYRSTKGASKARRDQINAEIRNLKDLLPISDADKARLSYLHIMSLACMYTRKSVFFTEAGPEERASILSFRELSELMQALPGFLMLLTGEGKLLYLSDSVSEHLGHSMVDLVAQGDSVYDIIDASDHFVMRSNLSTSSSLEMDRLFRCRFNTSKSVRRQSAGNKTVLIRARCLSPLSASPASGSYWTSNTAWVCFCSPLEPHPSRSSPGEEAESTSAPPLAETNLFLACFHSQHGRDMRLQAAQDSVSAYLGFDVTALRSCSWYSLLHPQDLSHASAQHRSLLREGGEGRAEMVVRVQTQDQSWVWLYMVLQLQPGEIPISSNNYIIRYLPPLFQRHTPDWDFLTQTSSWRHLSSWTPHVHRLPLRLPPMPTSQAQQTKEFVCTPPYTPHIAGSSFPFGEPLVSFDPAGTTTPPPPAATATSTTTVAPSSSTSAPPTTASSPPPNTTSTKLALKLATPSTDFLFSGEHGSGGLYEKLPPTPDSPGDGDCTVMTLPEVRGPLYVDVPLGPLQCPPEGLLTPEASPGKQPCLSFFSLEREKERAEISLLAQHISSLAEGFYLDPLLSKLSPPSMSPSSSPPSPFLSPATETADGDSVHTLREFYPIKAWRGLDFPMFLDDDDSLFEESILENLLQDNFIPPQSPGLSPPSPSTSPMPDLSSPISLQTPVCWHQPSQFEGAGRFCSVQSAQFNPTAGCGATPAAEASAGGEGLAEEAMEIEVVSSPVSSCSSIPASPPLLLTASPRPATSASIASPSPAVSRNQSLLEELAVLEPMFGAGASIAPDLGQQPELYQLQCHPSSQCFHKGKKLSRSLFRIRKKKTVSENTPLTSFFPFCVFQMGVEVFLRSKISL